MLQNNGEWIIEVGLFQSFAPNWMFIWKERVSEFGYTGIQK